MTIEPTTPVTETPVASATVSPARQPLSEEILQYLQVLAEDLDTAVDFCTPYGKGLKLLTNKPNDPYYAYVWRMARFHSGADMSMPMLCFYELGNAIERDFPDFGRVSFLYCDETRTQGLDTLDGLVDKLLVRVGLSRTRAAVRWVGALRGLGL